MRVFLFILILFSVSCQQEELPKQAEMNYDTEYVKFAYKDYISNGDVDYYALGKFLNLNKDGYVKFGYKKYHGSGDADYYIREDIDTTKTLELMSLMVSPGCDGHR